MGVIPIFALAALLFLPSCNTDSGISGSVQAGTLSDSATTLAGETMVTGTVIGIGLGGLGTSLNTKQDASSCPGPVTSVQECEGGGTLTITGSCTVPISCTLTEPCPFLEIPDCFFFLELEMVYDG